MMPFDLQTMLRRLCPEKRLCINDRGTLYENTLIAAQSCASLLSHSPLEKGCEVALMFS